MNGKRLFILHCSALFVLVQMVMPAIARAQNAMQPMQKEAFVIGESVRVKSEVLDEERILNIYLPAGYSADTLQKYPVIYLLDGSGDEDFIHIAGLVQFGSFSWIRMIPETIVVGIGNVDRRRDFTYPSGKESDIKELPTSGKSQRFLDFIQKELQPYVDSNYRTNAVRTLIGQSLGGLFATEMLFKQPDLFDNYIIVSPSLWWSDESLLALEPANYDAGKAIYIAVGKEGEVMERTAKALYGKLKKTSKPDTRLYFQYFERRNHGDVLHLAVYDAFEKIFRAKGE